MTPASNHSQLRANPVFWIMLALPASAVLAGLSTLAIALHSADRPLPPAYHWEGERLEEDFARARSAAALGIELTLTIAPQEGTCRLSLRHAPGDPAAIYLQLTHGVDAGLDRIVRLARVAAGEYRAGCAPIPAGRWRVSVEDEAHRWSVRGVADGTVTRLELRARNPDGAGA